MSAFLPYPLPANASLPAALTGPCVVYLCGNIAGGPNPPVSCDAILGLCQAGSSSFKAYLPPAIANTTAAPQTYPCNYDYKNGTANSYASVAVACGLVSLAATVTPQDQDNYLFNSLPSASGETTNILELKEYVPLYNATQWPTDWIDVRRSISSLSAYFQTSATSTGTSPSSTPTTPSKSGSVKSISLTSLLTASMALPLVLSALG